MERNIKIAVIGGDKRQISCIKELEADGFSVSSYGVCEKNTENSIENCIKDADAILLPIPYGDIRRINITGEKDLCAEELFSKLDKCSIVLAAKVDKELREMAMRYGIPIADYLNREDLNILNAVPTAEGAIEVAMRESDITIHSSKAIVLGYGRIGKILANYLKALGANVSIGVRSKESKAWTSALGFESFYIKDTSEFISEADMIFNTVPSMILTKELLEITKESVLITDLASKPGGIDMNSAKKLNRKVVWALSLPGKVAPVSAGRIIKECIVSILKEEGIL